MQRRNIYAASRRKRQFRFFPKKAQKSEKEDKNRKSLFLN